MFESTGYALTGIFTDTVRKSFFEDWCRECRLVEEEEGGLVYVITRDCELPNGKCIFLSRQV